MNLPGLVRVSQKASNLGQISGSVQNPHGIASASLHKLLKVPTAAGTGPDDSHRPPSYLGDAVMKPWHALTTAAKYHSHVCKFHSPRP